MSSDHGFLAIAAAMRAHLAGEYELWAALAGPLEDVAAWVVANGADVVLSSAIETALGRAAKRSTSRPPSR